MTTPTLIGITGPAGSGKDTVRNILQQHHGFAAMAFADPIRHMLFSLLNISGIEARHMLDRELKEQPIPGIGASYRHLAQTLGTEWGRGVAPDLWIRTARARLQTFAKAGIKHVVISDVRFINEAEFVRSEGGVIWRIERPQATPVRAHVSEDEMARIAHDLVIDNHSDSLVTLKKQVLTACKASGFARIAN